MTRRSSRTGLRALDALLLPLRRLRLGPTCLALPPEPLADDLPVLVVANHVSWWDGFLVRESHERIRPRDPFCIVMTERELARRPWLRWLGAVGIEPGSVPGVRRTVRELTARRRSDPRTFFVFFPQGAIWPSSRRPLGFRRGVERLATRLAPLSIVPAAIHVEPLNRAVPTPFLSLAAPFVLEAGRSLDPDWCQAAVEKELDELLSFVRRHGENAVSAWPAYRRRHEARRHG